MVPLNVVREAVPSLLQDLHNEFRWSWSWWCFSPLYCSLGGGIFHHCKAVTVTGTPVLVLLLFTSQRFCFSKALQHGGEGKPSCLDAKQEPSAEHTHWLVQHSSSSHQPRQLFLMSGFCMQHICVHALALCLSSFLSLREQQDKSFDNLFPG